MINNMGESDIGRVHAVMKGLKNIARRSQNGNEREASRIALGEINDFVERLPNNREAISYGAPNVREAVKKLREATKAWAIASRADTIEDAMQRALDRAGTSGSGANIENALRQEIRRVLDRPSRVRGFTTAEKDSMRDIVRGDFKGNALRWLGKLAPTGVIPGMIGLEIGHRLFGSGGIRQVLPLAVGHRAQIRRGAGAKTNRTAWRGYPAQTVPVTAAAAATVARSIALCSGLHRPIAGANRARSATAAICFGRHRRKPNPGNAQSGQGRLAA
jgi:hypothetical protein